MKRIIFLLIAGLIACTAPAVTPLEFLGLQLANTPWTTMGNKLEEKGFSKAYSEGDRHLYNGRFMGADARVGIGANSIGKISSLAIFLDGLTGSEFSKVSCSILGKFAERYSDYLFHDETDKNGVINALFTNKEGETSASILMCMNPSENSISILYSFSRERATPTPGIDVDDF